jgi:type VI secretion system protein ImpH
MATANGRKSAGVSEQLLREPFRFDFFQAVRFLNLLAYDRRPQFGPALRQPIGLDHPPEQEILRFRMAQLLRFPTCDISRVVAKNAGTDRSHLEMWITFLGLTGVEGALPYHYTSLIIRRSREKDYSLRDFLDLFNHRIVSLFHRSWEKYRLPITFERSQASPTAAEDSDPFTMLFFALVGFGTAGVRRRLEVDDRAFLFYAGHFANTTRSAVALEGILRDYLGLPATVLQAQPQWLTLDPDDRSVMPSATNKAGRNNLLGVNLVIGERVRDIQSKFRVRIGPLTREQFHRFMPSGPALRPLCQLIRTYVGPEFDFDVQLVLYAKEVPQLEVSPNAALQPRLGWNTWSFCREFENDVDDAVFVLPDV